MSGAVQDGVLGWEDDFRALVNCYCKFITSDQFLSGSLLVTKVPH
jgi:hypothetical protein